MEKIKVTFKDIGKITAIRAIRLLMNLSLREAKDIMDIHWHEHRIEIVMYKENLYWLLIKWSESDNPVPLKFESIEDYQVVLDVTL